MKVLFATRTIEVTKKFSKKAAIFGTEEYQLMREVLKDFPDFEIVVKATPVRHQTYMKGLTYDYMASHIARVDTDGSIMRDFEILRQGCSYFQIKNWFMTLFSEINNFAA